MDPKIRRDIWNLILQKKHKCVTIMTTHTMDEADLLGDRIAIMSEGRIKAKGTSVSLKNTYAGDTLCHLAIPLANALPWQATLLSWSSSKTVLLP